MGLRTSGADESRTRDLCSAIRPTDPWSWDWWSLRRITLRQPRRQSLPGSIDQRAPQIPAENGLSLGAYGYEGYGAEVYRTYVKCVNSDLNVDGVRRGPT